MSKIVVPGTARPSNLRLSSKVARVGVVESDMYNICHQVKEVSPNLYVIDCWDGPEFRCWAIMEQCKDGVDRLVWRGQELDGRVIKHLRKMIAIPLAKRIEILEKQAYKDQEAYKEQQLDELYDRIGRPMWTQLERDGFIQRNVSYPKRGIKK